MGMKEIKDAKKVVDSALRVLKIESIQIDESYQRGVNPGHRKIVTDFDQNALGIIVVGQRADGSYWGVDGRQRLEALKKIGKTHVRAEVFASNGPEHEARVFATINKNRTRISALDLFNAELTGHDKAAWEIKDVAEKLGFKIPVRDRGKDHSPELTAKTLVAINSLTAIYKKSGSGVLRSTLTAIRDSWPDDPLRVNGTILSAVGMFIGSEEGMDLPRLIDRLSKTTPGKILYSSSLGVGSKTVNAAQVIEKMYRKKR